MLHLSAALRLKRRERREYIVDTNAGTTGGKHAKELLQSLKD